MYFHPELLKKSINAFAKYYEINYFYNAIYFNTFLNAIKDIKQNDIRKDRETKRKNLLKIWFENMDREFDEKLGSDTCINLFNQYIKSSLDLFNGIGGGYISPQLIYHDFIDLYLKYFYSPSISYSKELNLSDHEIIFQKDNIKLLHYINNNTHHYHQQTKESENNNILLVIYAQINRFHILDLNPSKSIVRTLLNNGIDVYLLDWGYPDKKDNDLTLKDYVDYIDDAVNTIIQSRSSASSSPPIKISILGYCWGGITSLIYTAINQKNIIDKLILMATPIDFSKDNTTVSMWTKSIDTDKIIDTFGHFDGYFLDFVFNMRNPAKFIFGKYFNLWKHLENKEFLDIFFDVEKWLHDTPPIPGELYKKIVNECYRDNLLITGNMKLENQKPAKEGNDNNDNLININRITIPVLSIIAEKDDLVSPISSLAINNYISSKETETFTHPGGHVSLCISDQAHKELWPKVADWIRLKI
jgi:polyhydroxyalkanoate synthase